ncbi:MULTISPECIES: phage tail protein [unclassified Pseudomonas]|uniref:phage tail protein n=1 Tax=unclassified Pseudomonas TaxID=196821 RepID=UPI000C887174|nr:MULTISPECIES: phage tail protein [unclassified Pseudomonas]PMX25343.1 phage tail protein [Pseudomonas sp. GW460-12]PMX36566.1 phage tail protein [Pseudomonas sp. MPR-R2A4]PMX41378.1 phage tail protein [Pseudomonas sp. MPR-R2A7]PMX54174.1 phage tail protein [Pseudomonas sp. MPR-R2A6]PMX91783.1 phage tail protein [Pseudomonas sp. MPR-R2A3]
MADFYTLLTNAGIAYETACKAAGVPIKLAQISVGDGNGAVYNPDATAKALKREVWRGPLNALFQDERNPSWLLAEVTIPPEVGGWYVREAGLWTDTGVLYAIVKYPESFKPVLAMSGSGKEFYIRSVFETSNASQVTLLIDDTVVKATRAWVMDYVADELAKLDAKQSVRVATTTSITLSAAQVIDGVAVVAGDRVLVKNQTAAKDNGLYMVANTAWVRAKDADLNAKVTSAMTVSVEQGVTLADTIWQLVTDGAIVLGTTPLSFQNVTQGFAPLNSPAFQGLATAPSAPRFDNSSLLATTEWTRRLGKQYSGSTSISNSGSIPAAAVGQMTVLFGDTVSTVDLPVSSDLPNGATVTVICYNTVSAAVTRAGTDLIYGADPGQSVSVKSIRMIYGDILELTLLNNVTGAGAWYVSGGNMFASAVVPQFDISQRPASTQFVQRALGNYNDVSVLSVSASLTSQYFGRVLLLNSSTEFTVTLPPSSTGPVGSVISVRNVGSVNAKLVPAGTDTIAVIATRPQTSLVIPPGSSVDLVLQGTNYFLSGAAALKLAGEFASSIDYHGYQKLPNGLIIQWGTAVSNGTGFGNWSATLPITFPTACLSGSILGNGGATVFSLTSMTTNALSATAMLSTTGAATSKLGGFFIVIGY